MAEPNKQDPKDKPKSGKKVVVLHTVVRKPNRKEGSAFHFGAEAVAGQVLPAEDFGDESNLARLKDAGAIRDASAEECDQEKVDLQKTPDTAKVEAAASKDRRITDLENELAKYKARDGDDAARKAAEEADRTRSK